MNIKELYLRNDRVINKNNINELIQVLCKKFNLNLSADYWMPFFTSYKFQTLDENTKREILKTALKMNFNYNHEILTAMKQLAMIKNGNTSEKYELEDSFLTSIIDSEGTIINEHGVIKVETIQGPFNAMSALEFFKNDDEVLKYIFPIKLNGHCFSNSIFLLEHYQTGKILFMQINNGFNTYLHAVYLTNNNQIIDLNYLTLINYNDFLKLYNPTYVTEIDFGLWTKLKEKTKWRKKEAVLVSYGIVSNINNKNTEDNETELIEYLDNNGDFISDKRLH
jgi:hypothetical protein